jgi:hypothetical protein
MCWWRSSSLQARRCSLRLQSRVAAEVRPLLEGDGATHSPDEAFWWSSHSIDTAHAANRGDNYGCWLHTPRAGFHQLLCAAPGHEAPGLRGNAGSHLAGAQSPVPRSDQLSRRSPWWGEHTLRLARRGERVDAPELARCAVEGQEQTRSFGPDQGEADGPVRVSGSRPTGTPVASTLGPRPSDCTIGRDRSPGLHLKAPTQRPRDAGTIRRHRRR